MGTSNGAAFDPYRVLGLARDATADEIKATYRALAKELHPDVNPDSPEAEERFKKITEAYELLGDPAKRTAYDESHPDGSPVLNEVRTAIKKFVILPSEHAYVAVTLWIAATYGLPKFEHATRLAIHSAVKRCGKSRLLEVIEALAYSPISTTNTSVAALFRLIEAGGNWPPSLILDEADRLFGSTKKDEDNRDLIALINNGFRPGNPTWRCVGPNQTPTAFSNYAMAVIAGIGRKPDTIEDRAVNITMRRRLPGEKVEKFRLRRDRAVLHKLRDERLTVWIKSVMRSLADEVTDLPDGLEDRAADTWEPLIAVADAAGGAWPELARAAAVALSTEADEDSEEESEEVRLLRDVYEVFEAQVEVTFLATSELLFQLAKIEDAPWGSDLFTPHKLAAKLRPFKIGPKPNTAGDRRGYYREHFADAWARYVPGYAGGPSEPSKGSETGSEQEERVDGSEASDTPDRQTDFDSTASDTPDRRSTSNRQDETAGQIQFLTDLTVLTGTPPANGSSSRNGHRRGPYSVTDSSGRKHHYDGDCKCCGEPSEALWPDGRCSACLKRNHKHKIKKERPA